MTVTNDLESSHLVTGVIDRVPKVGYHAAHLKQHIRDKWREHKHYIAAHGQDMPDIRVW